MVLRPATDDRIPAQPAPPAPAPPTSLADPALGVAARAAPPVEVAGVDLVDEVLDLSTGVRHRTLAVDDGPASADRPQVLADFAEQDALLRANPQWLAPEVVGGELVLHNEVSRWFYRSAAMREWRRELVPGASALYPVQRPTDPRLPSGAPIDALARSIFTDCLDSIGIRTRAQVLREVVQQAARAAPEPPRGTVQRAAWVSLACGAAVPVLDAVATLEDTPGADPHLHLVDLDPAALVFARELATARGLVEGADFSLLERDLVTGVVARDSLVDELGEASASVVDAVGIFEYFRDAACVRLLRNAYRLLRPGGVLVVANMLSDRRELQMNQRGIGWPRLFPRSSDQLVELVRLAGLPLARTTVSIPTDGIYAVVDVRR